MKSTVWKRNRGKILIAIAALLIALTAAIGSGAYFTSVSSNPGNVITAGVLTHTNSNPGAAFMNLGPMFPGQTLTGSVTITNTGTVNGTLSLTQTSYTDTPGTVGTTLSTKLTITIVDLKTSSTIYSGTIAAMGTSAYAAGTIAPGAGNSHTYQWTVLFPDGGKPAGPTTGDNAFQGSSVNVRYDWEMVTP
jgi:spore coat-associated protein N